MSFKNSLKNRDYQMPEAVVYLPFHDGVWQGVYPTKPEMLVATYMDNYVRFDGGGKIEFTELAPVHPTKEFTIAASVRTFEVSSYGFTVINGGTIFELIKASTSTYFLKISKSTSSSEWSMYIDDGTTTSTTSLGELEEQVWIHFAVTYHPSGIVTVYVNGSYVADVQTSLSSSDYFNLYTLMYASLSGLEGLDIKNMVVFDSMLTAAQVGQLAQEQLEFSVEASGAHIPHTHTESDITDLDKYTKSEVDTLLAGKSDVGHTHVEADITDLDKYTKAEVDTKLATKSDVGHTHVEADITDLDKYTKAQVDSLLANKSDVGHTHTTADLTDYTEATQDLVGAMVSGNTETGISVTYDDTNGKLDFVVSSSGGQDFLYTGKAASFSAASTYTWDYVDGWDYTVSEGSSIAFTTGTGQIALTAGTYEITWNFYAFFGGTGYYVKYKLLDAYGTSSSYTEHAMFLYPRDSYAYYPATYSRVFKFTSSGIVYPAIYVNNTSGVRLDENFLSIKKIA